MRQSISSLYIIAKSPSCLGAEASVYIWFPQPSSSGPVPAEGVPPSLVPNRNHLLNKSWDQQGEKQHQNFHIGASVGAHAVVKKVGDESELYLGHKWLKHDGYMTYLEIDLL